VGPSGTIAAYFSSAAGTVAGLAAAVWLAWGHGPGLADVLLAAGRYAVTGMGVTVGFHRLLTHRSFTAGRPDARHRSS
jgi:fatty-acid desaturase